MKIIMRFFFSAAFSMATVSCAMEQNLPWDAFIFVPALWKVTPFLALQNLNAGHLEDSKTAFIASYRNQFVRLFGDDKDFLRWTAQQLMCLSCERRLTGNPARILKG